MIARLAAAAMLFAVAACATLAPPETPAPQLAGVPASFEMTGRLALRRGQESEIAQLRWTRRGGADTWVLASPLGNEVARIESNARGATLYQASGGGAQADSFEDLTDRILGVALDPAALAQALHGSVPGHLPAGWRFTIDETQPAGKVTLAKRLTVTDGRTVVKLVVDSYQALPD
jgi:outer membrane biogenesis lipoprotein LolB